MSRKRPVLSDVFKDVAMKLAREAERYVGAQDSTLCANCPGTPHTRAQHCGCGTACLGDTDGGTRACECPGFSPKAEG